MPKPQERYWTGNAIKELAKEFNLPYDKNMQDWPYEVSRPDSVEQYLEHYRASFDDDKRFVLMDMIIQAVNDQKNKTSLEFYWDIVKEILTLNFLLHSYTIYYWANLDEDYKDVDESELFEITPFMRVLWKENCDSF